MALIDKWYYSNLEARPDRRHLQEIIAAIQRMPEGLLQRFPAAIENTDMPDTVAEVCDLIVADGFPEWNYDTIINPERRMPSDIAVNLTRLRILRHIIESGENAVMVSDSYCMLEKYDVIESIIASAPDDMKILCLEWHTNPCVPGHFEALSELEPSGVKGILKNFRLCSMNVYLTNDGAQHLLDLWKTVAGGDGQNIIYHAGRRKAIPIEGVYACNPMLGMGFMTLRDCYGNISDSNIFGLNNRSEPRAFEAMLRLEQEIKASSNLVWKGK